MSTYAVQEFEAYARARQQRFYGTAFLLCGDAERAQDLTRTTFAKLFQHWRKATRASDIDIYAKTVLTRTYIAAERSRRHMFERHSNAVDHEQTCVTLLDALHTLTPNARAMVVLRYWENLPIDRVAEALSCKPESVKSTCIRALSRLRTLLPEDIDLHTMEA
ncbi:sigma factor-like helix-turn-helix DNA-binding protein [Yinghuangia seranimata]|uniref:sigma factor-like helix-turn-helix DNA-binding protein n=1 Tax=Yinghuangia seranimata TaxID=408067 RepID=UPI00248CAB02|nr:sigma factor-like helix-turn-helix DNA-binding protein [Yinghuangia seranimata]MDI2128855.1 sigma factor-like helix-turn-helix DNA-binding protein [Yinghuangia seranimata]